MAARFTRIHTLTALIAFLALVHIGCNSSQRGQHGTRTSRISQKVDDQKLNALQRDLNQLDEFVAAQVETAVSQLDRSENNDVRRAAQEWKLAITRLTIDDPDFEHPVAKMLDMWSNAVRIEHFFTTGRGKEVFGEEQQTITETLTELRSRVESLAHTYLSQADYDQLAIQVEQFAKDNPVKNLRALEASSHFSNSTAVASTLEIPWKPLSWIGGVRESLDPTSTLANSVDGFTELARKYPDLMRVQSKLLLMDINRNETVTTTVKSMDRIATSSERFADIAENLPEQLREESTILIQDSHEAIKTVDNALGKAERLSQTFDGTVSEFSQAGEVWVGTADAVTRTIEQIQKWTPYVNDPTYPRPKPCAPGETPRFDINDYTRVAEAVGESSIQVQGLLADVRDFVDGHAPGTDLARVNALAASLLDPTAAQARDLVDLITYRAAQLVALIFLLVTVYVFLSRRVIGLYRRT